MATQRKQWVSWEEFDALFPGLTPYSVVDFQRIGGLTEGSIPFADAAGMLTEDNANFFWDEANVRLGIGIGVPVCTGHFQAAVCPDYAGIGPDTILLLENDDNVALQLQCATNAEARIVFADNDYNPPAGRIMYDFTGDYMDFTVGKDVLVKFEKDGADSRIISSHRGIKVDSPSYAAFIADSHNADAYFALEEDTALKWTIGFDFTDGLKFQISEGLPGISVRFEIEPGVAGLINLYQDTGIRNRQDLRFYDNGNYVGFKAPALAADQIWVFPDADAPAANQCLMSDAAGNLDWSQALGTTDNPLFANLNLGASPFIHQASGAITFMTDEGVNTNTYVNIKGKGSGYGILHVYGEDDEEYLQLYSVSRHGFMRTQGTVPGRIYIQQTVAQDVRLWSSIPAGNPSFYIYGFKAADAVKWGRMAVGGDGVFRIDVEIAGYLQQGGANALFWSDANVFIYQNTRLSDDKTLCFGTDSDYSIGYHEPTDTLQIVDGSTLNASIRAKLDATGNWYFGDGGVTNYAQIAPDGEINLHGTARVLRHLHFNNAAFTKGSTAPTQVILGNHNGWEFDIGDDSVIIATLPDDWDPTTDITIKVCWYIDEAYAVDKEIQWRVDWSAIPEDFTETVDAPTHSGQIDSGDINIPAVAKTIGESTIGTIAAASLSALDCLGFTISRIAVTNDNPTADPVALHLTIEYVSNKLGIAT